MNDQLGPSLNINDLQVLLNVVELCSQRGAFRANELELIGATYNKITAFINNPRDQNLSDSVADDK